MTDERHAVLSALIDRELVDPEVLAAVLDAPDARDMLVDFVRVRALVAAEVDAEITQPGAAFATQRSRTAWKLVATAMVPLALGLSGGYWWRERAELRPPTPSRIVHFVPGVDWK